MKSWVGFTLAWIAGFVDTSTFMGARGLFSAHVTGNFILFAAAAVRGVESLDYLKVFLFIPFVGGVALVGVLARTGIEKGKLESLMYALAGVLLLASGVYFINVRKLPDERENLSENKPQIEKCKGILKIVFGFASGCILSAVLISKTDLSLGSLMIPAVAMLSLSFSIYRQRRMDV